MFNDLEKMAAKINLQKQIQMKEKYLQRNKSDSSKLEQEIDFLKNKLVDYDWILYSSNQRS